MWTKKELILFIAGAEAFHTYIHGLMYFNILSVQLPYFAITPQVVLFGFVFNAFVTVALLWWASKLK